MFWKYFNDTKKSFMLNIILFGPPGSGKGTQAEKIRNKYNLDHVSTGDLFRYELKNETELGKRVKKYLDLGQLVPDEITIEMLVNKIKSFDSSNGFLLDGFPRNILQAESLDKVLKEMNTEVSMLIALEVAEEEIVKRILNRGKTSGRSDDNDESIIRDRYNVYKDLTRPVYNYYSKKNKAKSINGVGEIEEIFCKISSEIEKLKEEGE